MLSALVFLSLCSTIICLCLGIMVFSFNRKSNLNKLFFLGAVTTFLYTFSSVMMWLSPNYATAYFWNKIEETWPFFIAVTFNFVLVFTESKWLKNKLTYLMLYLPAVVFFLINVSTNLIDGAPILQSWGYSDVATGTWIYNVSTVWSALLPIFAFILSLRFYLRRADPTQKVARRLVCVGFGIPCFTFIATNMLLPAIAISVPDLGIISLLFFSGFVAYAILKVDLFTFDPALAAENILLVMPDALLLADINLKILRVNEHLVNFFGYAEKDLIGEPVSKLSLNGGAKVCSGLLDELMVKGTIKNRELTVVTSSGDKKCVLLSGSVVKSKTSRVIGSVCIFHDITLRKQMADKLEQYSKHLEELVEQRTKQLAEAQAQLVKAERFAAIGELAGMVGHDLRNPLTGIKNAAYFLEKKGTEMPAEQSTAMLKTIDRCVDHSNKIINDLLDYSREVYLEPQESSPIKLLSEALAIMQIPEKIKIINHLTGEPLLKVDVNKMERVFINLMKNAIDAMPNGGILTVESKRVNGSLQISVIDTGAGIPDKVLPKLFSPLVTTKARGMGFGLAICKRIVEAHEGKISVETAKDKGSTFTVTLPIKPKLKVEGEKVWINMPESLLLTTTKAQETP